MNWYNKHLATIYYQRQQIQISKDLVQKNDVNVAKTNFSKLLQWTYVKNATAYFGLAYSPMYSADLSLSYEVILI